MKKLIISSDKFTEILLGLIKSGVTFEATETKLGDIEVNFLGGF